jgi:hypothetical protein
MREDQSPQGLWFFAYSTSPIMREQKGSIMRNRALQMKLVSDPEKQTQMSLIEREIAYDSLAEATNKVVKKVGMGVIAYVIVDTLRKVAVERAKRL